MSLRRLLFASCHSYIDPSSGAAWATRDVLELLAARGVECRAISTGVLSYERETALAPMLKALEVPIRQFAVPMDNGVAVDACSFELGRVGVTLVRTASSRIERAPDRMESHAFLKHFERTLDEFKPQALLTYGGHSANLALMAQARQRGVPVVFHLHNLAYDVGPTFANVTALIVPSEYARRHYARRLGRESVAIPSPLIPARTVAIDRDPRYVTFINPQAAKGAAVFARIAAELSLRRPEIPFLVVEGRRSADGLAEVKLDLSALRNLNRLPNVSDPRAIYRLTRILLAPSLVRETFGRVASEAMANGIPVLASDRGSLPETLGDAGFVLTIPERCTPTSDAVPTAHEVAPWVATIERLWDDPEWEATHQERARVEARRWDPDFLANQYLSFFTSHVS
ncbi:Glycosyltransferase involved in cell wall bisynthesis [Singulisphaera sp. GP187]|uniref:glycosyltransferase n=1 Tax=Singulisphaera sp. GP187 TaxID=1882752 RepID=UPI000926D878|nr:glycosyltransferase [Singulisphaera sp. GP187]SIO58948.1 Glycosyltransferase involved in cell wall bisynthesis [Singulisphaera sp. GP187]